jgi:hypothetical protein
MLSGGTRSRMRILDWSGTTAGTAPASHSKNYLRGRPGAVFLYFSVPAFDAGISNRRIAAFLAPNQ